MIPVIKKKKIEQHDEYRLNYKKLDTSSSNVVQSQNFLNGGKAYYIRDFLTKLILKKSSKGTPHFFVLGGGGFKHSKPKLFEFASLEISLKFLISKLGNYTKNATIGR